MFSQIGLYRASKIVENVLAANSGNYEAMRLRSEIEMEQHGFAQVAEYSEELTKIAPDDPWNWGTLGDSMMSWVATKRRPGPTRR